MQRGAPPMKVMQVLGDDEIGFEVLAMVDVSEKERARVQADDWIFLTKEGHNTVTDEQFDKGFELNIQASDDPEFAWEVFEDIVGRFDLDDISSKDRNDAKMILENLGSGPLETFVASNGERFVDRIAKATEDPRFKYALSSMWQNATPDATWSKIQRILGRA